MVLICLGARLNQSAPCTGRSVLQALPALLPSLPPDAIMNAFEQSGFSDRRAMATVKLSSLLFDQEGQLSRKEGVAINVAYRCQPAQQRQQCQHTLVEGAANCKIACRLPGAAGRRCSIAQNTSTGQAVEHTASYQVVYLAASGHIAD